MHVEHVAGCVFLVDGCGSRWLKVYCGVGAFGDVFAGAKRHVFLTTTFVKLVHKTKLRKWAISKAEN